MLRTLILAIFSVAIAFAQQNVPLSIIVCASEPEARQILSRLQSGADFGAVAKQQSIDPSASDDGYLGLMDPAKLRNELKSALAGLHVGQISDIVRIPSGFAILKWLNSAQPGAETPAAPTRIQALSSAGSVRLTYDYSGLAAALQAVNRFDKPEGWNREMKVACEVRTAAIPAAERQVQAMLTRPDATPSFVRDVNLLLGDLHSYGAEFNEAVRFWETSYKIAATESPERLAQIEESIGSAYLQRAGLTLYKDFTFPQSVHVKLTEEQTSDLSKAIDYFKRNLKRDPANGEVRWLLNLTFMLSGRYPDSVPREYLIDPAIFKSQEDVVHFRDVAQASGLLRTAQAGGLVVDDFDNDGLLDVMMSSVNDCEPLMFYHNNGDGTFTNRSAQAGLLAQTGGLNIVQADYNNDGCLDLLVLRGGWEYGRRKSLLKNNCDGTFTDVTKESGLGDLVTATQTAAWTDIDNDGNLDLFVGNENAPAQLFLNRGDGTFIDVAKAAGVDSRGFTKGVVAADYDNDGFPDLYVSALNGEHHLFHNNHNKTFTNVTREAGVEGPWTTFGAMFFDYDNDGWQDLLVAGYGVSVEDVMNGYMKKPQGGEPLRLFRNLGDGKFRDVTSEMGLKKVFMPMGLNNGDIDNDGFPDLYLGSGNPSYASPIPNVMFHNRVGKSFTDVTASSGTGILPKGHGIAFADLDNDGDEDIVVVMGGAVPGDRQTARLFENPGNGNDWLSVRLVGVKSNRSAIGARIKVTVRDSDGTTRAVHRNVSSGGSFGAGPLEQHLGLAKIARIEKVEVFWPTSGTHQSLTGIQKNQRIEIQESATTARVLKSTPFKLGKARLTQ